MFALVPIIVLVGGLSVGAFDDSKVLDFSEQTFADNLEMNISVDEVASLELTD